MPYTPTTWVDGTTMGNQTRMNNLETQYTEATNSLEQDLLTAFILVGLVCSKDGTTANQLDVTSGTAFLKQTDNTLRHRSYTATNFTTSTPSTTYFLDTNPDGSWSWGTSHSSVTNHLTVCSVATDGSGNISTVTDARTLNSSFLINMAGNLDLPNLYNNVNLKSGWFNWEGTLGGSAQEVFGFVPTDGTKAWGIFYNTDGSISWYDVTDGKTPLKVVPAGGVVLDSSALTTDGTGLMTWARTNSSGNQLASLMNNFGLWSDNIGGTFSGGTTRLWFSAAGSNGTQEIHFGPRAGSTALAGARFLTANLLVDGTGAPTPGTFTVQGGLKTSLDAGHITTDGNGFLTIAKLSSDGATLTSDGSGNLTGTSFMGKLKTVRNGTGQANTIFTGSTTPTSPAVGDIWLNQ